METTGRTRLFSTPDELWQKCEQYFEWAQANPIRLTRCTHNKILAVQKTRPFSVAAMCLHMKIHQNTFRNYAARPEFLEVCTRALAVIQTQQFEGVAVGEFHPRIIGRVLGLGAK